MRTFSVACILLAVSVVAGAQNVPNFGGVYLRESLSGHGSAITVGAAPIVLQVTQNPDHLRVSARLNDTEATADYNLTGTSPRKTPAGWELVDHVRMKRRELRIETDRSRSQFGTAQRLGSWTTLKQTWQLSRDGNTLTIRREYLLAWAPVLTLQDQETYVRQPSLQAALSRAGALAGPNKCNLVSDQLKAKAQDSRRTPPNEDGVTLGSTLLERVDESVLISTDLSGAFFRKLKKITEKGQVTFRRDGQTVTEFPDSITFEAQPRPWTMGLYGIFPREAAWAEEQSPAPLDRRTLRFSLEWLGEVERDLGEIQPELRTEPWRELGEGSVFYHAEVPSKGIPLTDTLRVDIFAADGTQLGCIRGNI